MEAWATCVTRRAAQHRESGSLPPPLLGMSAAEVDAYFGARLGCGPDGADNIEVMQAMGIEGLEALQGEADDVLAGGRDEAARGRGLEWSTRIGRFIA